MKPDLLITWIKHCDYPIFRYWIRKYRDHFDRIIIYWSEHNRFPYYDHFIHDSMIGDSYKTLFMDPTFTDWSIGEDWRNHATREMLKYSNSEWVCSIEQDFFCRNWDNFFLNAEQMMKETDLFGWMNNTQSPYIHPACWFMKREALEKTTKDFSPHSEMIGMDHFAWITKEARELNMKIGSFAHADLTTPANTEMFHLGGVNQNYLDFEQRFKDSTIHRSDIFYVYNWWSMQMRGQQSPLFYQRCKLVDQYLKSKHPEIIPELNDFREFFKLW